MYLDVIIYCMMPKNKNSVILYTHLHSY